MPRRSVVRRQTTTLATRPPPLPSPPRRTPPPHPPPRPQPHFHYAALTAPRHPHPRRLGDSGVRHTRRLHPGRPQAVAGELDGVVTASAEVPEAVVGDFRPIAMHPDVRPSRPVGLQVAPRILPEAKRHPDIRLADDQLANLALHRLHPVVVDRGIHARSDGRKGVRGGVRLDVSALSLDDWVISNPKPPRYFQDRNLDFHEEEMILAPEAHFFMGGVVVDEWGESQVPGLFAVGEAAGGVHGANRLDSNAIPETQVFGARAGQAAAVRSKADKSVFRGSLDGEWKKRLQSAESQSEAPGFDYAELRKALQATMWQRLGIVRTAAQLEVGLRSEAHTSERL